MAQQRVVRNPNLTIGYLLLMLRSLALFALLVAFLAFSEGASSNTSKLKEKKVQVVSTVAFLADVFDEVTCSSNSFETTTLVPAQLDPHHYQFRPEDRGALEKADLVLSIGRGFETWMQRVKRTKSKTWVDVAGKMELRKLEGDKPNKKGKAHSHSHHHHDVNVDIHIWHSPELVRETALVLASAAKKMSPSESKLIDDCRAKFDAKLESSVLQIKTLLQNVPKERRVFVVSHDAMRYFTDFFGFKVFSISKLYDSALRTPADFRNVVKNIEETKADVAFLNATGSGDKEISRIAEESTLKVGGKLYMDGPGPAGSGAETVLGMWTKNAETLLAGLLAK